MAAFDRTRVTWTYTSDDGVAMPYRTLAGYSTQAALGGAAFTGIIGPTKRYGMKVRRVLVKGDITGIKRWVPVFTKAAYSAIVAKTTAVNIPDASLTTLEAGVVQTLEGERHHGAGIV